MSKIEREKYFQCIRGLEQVNGLLSVNMYHFPCCALFKFRKS